MSHSNLAVFVPHSGCQNQCSFCDQRRISGTAKAPGPGEVRDLCERNLPGAGGDIEIAFFGGSFTAIDHEYMTALLQAAQPFVLAGRARGIRVSTRPDAIDDAVLDVLLRNGVTAIELGAQSMDDTVLRKNKRGHTAADVRRASAKIRERGFSLGLQMMPGLYGAQDCEAEAVATANALIACGPRTVRIYPTVVLKNTELHDLWKGGQYIPLSLDAAAEITAKLLVLFESAGIEVIRVGLHADASLQSGVAAGPFHPAFGEIARSRVLRADLMPKLRGKPNGVYTIGVRPENISALIGQNRENSVYFEQMGYRIRPEKQPGTGRYQTVILKEKPDFVSEIHRDTGV